MIIKKEILEDIYLKYTKRELVHPDPLEFLYPYENVRDREIVALIASSLAYGRVAQILRSVSIVLEKMGASPFDFVMNSSNGNIRKIFKNFKHRFSNGSDLSNLLIGIERAAHKYGSLNNAFTSLGMAGFVNILKNGCNCNLLPDPNLGSACKRLNLFLRWMVREDQVDPGGWKGIKKSNLIVPLDTHMFKIGCLLGFTKRKVADIVTAREITSGLAKFSADDPVKYDFALTRFGIRDDMNIENLLTKLDKN